MDFKVRKIDRTSQETIDRDCLAYVGLDLDSDNELGLFPNAIKHAGRFARLVDNEANMDLIFAESGKGIVGLAQTNFAWRERGNAMVESFYVKPSFRGFGISGKLMSVVEGMASQRGVERVVVYSGSKALRDFYAERGYAPFDDEHLMSLDVSKPKN